MKETLRRRDLRLGQLNKSGISATESTREESRFGTTESKIDSRVGFIDSRSAMPSVGMRRTTRVFGVVKGADGARVLRSGRRLWPDELKLRKCDEGGGDWLQPLIKKSNGNRNGPGGLKCKPNGWAHAEEGKVKRSGEVVTAFYEHDDTEMKAFNKVEREDEEEKAMVEDKMFGNVYTRKRKRNGGTKKEISEDKMHGIKYFRRRKGKKTDKSSISGDSDRVLSKRKSRGSRVFGVVFEGSCSSRSSGFFCFLNLVMGFLKNERIKLRGLASFLLSQPTTAILSPHGLRCLWVCPLVVIVTELLIAYFSI